MTFSRKPWTLTEGGGDPHLWKGKLDTKLQSEVSYRCSLLWPNATGPPAPSAFQSRPKFEQRWSLLQPTGARPHNDTLRGLGASVVFNSNRLSEPAWMKFLILCTEKELLSQLRMRPAEWRGGGLIRSLPWGCNPLTFTLLAKLGMAGLFRRTSCPADCNWSFHLLRLYKVDFCSPLRRGL